MSERERIRAKYMGIFDKLDHYTPEQRGEVMFLALNTWCPGCGETLYDCMEPQDNACCGVETRTVLIEQCPTCEAVHPNTTRPLYATTSTPTDSQPPARPAPEDREP